MQVTPPGPPVAANNLAAAVSVARTPVARTETTKAVQASEPAEREKETQLKAKRETEDSDDTAPKPRGSMVDMRV